MQELKYNGQDYAKYSIPEKMTGVTFDVSTEGENVILAIGGQKIVLTKTGARDLALVLRQGANQVERSEG